MADISKCGGHGCKKKETCYRFTAKPSLRQSYACYDNSPDKCDSYIEVKSKSQMRRLKVMTMYIMPLIASLTMYIMPQAALSDPLGLYTPPKAQLQSNQVPFCNDKIKQMSRLIYKLQMENSAIRLVLRATKGIGPIR